MPTDFPAAHSMDSCWFAVDAAGHVAFFDTGEGGAIPTEDAFPKGGEAGSGDELELRDLVLPLIAQRAAGNADLAALLGEYPAWKELLEEALWEEADGAESLVAWLGLFRYECREQWAAPYERTALVPTPILLDALPADLREQLANARLPLRFDVAREIAIPAHAPSAAWGKEWQDVDGSPHAFEGQISEKTRAEFAEYASAPPVESPEIPAFDDAAAVAFLREILSTAPPPRPASAPGGFLGWLGDFFRRK